MSTLALLLLVIVAGLGLTVQVVVNARLRVGVESPVLGALISFVVGTLALIVLALTGAFGRGRLTGLGLLPWWVWIGGLFGAFYVTISIITLPRLGASVVICAAVFGQLIAALVVDSFGLLGAPRLPLNLWRILGALLLFAGVLLMQRK